jgi:hypothetical protein
MSLSMKLPVIIKRNSRDWPAIDPKRVAVEIAGLDIRPEAGSRIASH